MDEIKLTLEPTAVAAAQPAPAPVQAKPVADAAPKAFTEVELKQIDEFSQKIDVTDSNIVLQYGADAQKNMADFSEAALSKVKTKDMGEVGDMINDLVVELRGFSVDAEEKKGKRLFKKLGNRVEVLKARYNTVEENVDKMIQALEDKQIQLLRDIAMLDQMYDKNLIYHKQLSMYIAAGKKCLKEVRETTLVELRNKAMTTGAAEDVQAANDFENKLNRFEKKIYDLELTRTVSIQMAPQIRMIQNNDSLMVEKIQSSIVNTIPLWKNQMVIALALYHGKEAMEAQNAVNKMTNQLLRENSEKLKQGTLDVARESEKGIVDIETLRLANENLITTLDEVKNIQAEGSAKRREAEKELATMEQTLKNKLMEFK